MVKKRRVAGGGSKRKNNRRAGGLASQRVASRVRGGASVSSRARGGVSASRGRRFIRALVLSAAASFGVATYALHPPGYLVAWAQSAAPALGAPLNPLQWPASIAGWVQSLQPWLARLGWQPQADAPWLGNRNTSPDAWYPQPDFAPLVASDGPQVQTRFTQCPQFFPQQQPPVVPAGGRLRELCFDAFAILHNGQTKTPVFVAQRLNRQALLRAQYQQRTDRFYAEARLPQAERAELADYRGSGWSRGHLAPAADMDSAEAMAQSFSLANMAPQDQTHNAGSWSRIEQDTRKYVMRARGDVYVFSGPVYAPPYPSIGPGRVAVPQYFFKLVWDAQTGRSWVHWHANQAEAKAGRPIDYQEFVRRTGLHLLPSQPAQ